VGHVPRWTLVLGLSLFVLTVACGSESESGGSGPSGSPDMATTSTSGPGGRTSGTTGAPVATEAVPTTVAATTVSGDTAPGDPAACDVQSILPVVAGLFPENDAWKIIGVDIANCQNGYARVFALPDQSDCPNGSICRENEQVFLVAVDGDWEYLESGTGIVCPDPFVLAACEALGLP
jgi:hypothetical protein